MKKGSTEHQCMEEATQSISQEVFRTQEENIT